MVTGPGNAGKTCLVEKLVHGAFPENTSQTNGIDVLRWTQPGDTGLQLLFYDFGGQPVYATSHQLFLRTRAIFVVLWNPRAEQVTDLQQFQLHSYVRDVLDATEHPAIIFVSSHKDR
eukprot:scaffold5717_cov120-Pinguiococcus_pyrenoidosus.AAC.2